ncbi:MAG: hypothetical protein Q7R52_03635 [archaeon]|nr:hypothetical protein [archaeon]
MERIRKLIFPSIVFLVGSLILLFANLQNFITILGIIASFIQIAMFIYWIIEDDNQSKILETTIENQSDLKETKEIAKEIKNYQNNKEGILLKRQEILTTLIKGGAIPNKEISKIIKSAREKGIFLVSTLGGKEFRLKNVLKTMGKSGPISLVPAVLKKFGFKGIYFNDTLFIVLKEDLPERLRKPEILRKTICNELMNKWKQIQDQIIKNNLKVHSKWIEGSGFNCSICVIDIEEGEIGVLYKRLHDSQNYRDNFSEEFKSLLLGHSDKRNIGEIVQNKVKAKQILDKMSLGFLFINLPEEISNSLIKNELEITKKLSITKFLDISNIKKEKLEAVISKYIPSERVKEISIKIMRDIEDYVKVVRELNLF